MPPRHAGPGTRTGLHTRRRRDKEPPTNSRRTSAHGRLRLSARLPSPLCMAAVCSATTCSTATNFPHQSPQADWPPRPHQSPQADRLMLTATISANPPRIADRLMMAVTRSAQKSCLPTSQHSPGAAGYCREADPEWNRSQHPRCLRGVAQLAMRERGIARYRFSIWPPRRRRRCLRFSDPMTDDGQIMVFDDDGDL